MVRKDKLLTWCFICVALGMACFIKINIILFLGMVVISLLILKLKRVFFFERIDIDYTQLAFSILLFYGVLSALSNYYGYSNFFFRAVDDSFYFYRAKDLADGVSIGITSMYEIFHSFVLKALKIFGPVDESFVIYLLPINYAFISIGIETVSHIYFKLFKENVPLKIMVGLVLLNSNFLGVATPFYREAFILLFFPLAIYYIISEKYLQSIVVILIVLSLRGAFGMLLFGFLAMYLMYRRGMKTVYIIALLFVFIVAYVAFDYLTPYLSFLGQETNTLSIRLETRANMAAGSGRAIIFSNPVLRIFFYMLAPINFIPLYGQFEVIQRISTWENASFVASFWNWPAVFSWYTTIMLALMIPRILIGLLKSIKSDNENVFLISVFVIFAWLCTAIFSMQIRHFTVLIMLFPVFYHVWHEEHGRTRDATMAGFLLLLGIIILNVM